MIKWLMTVFIGLSLFCVIPTSCSALDVILEWDANTETNLAGYRLFCREAGEEYNYEYPDWDGTGTTGTITDLADGITYYFVARAYNRDGQESENSNEVCWDKPEEEEEYRNSTGGGCFIGGLV